MMSHKVVQHVGLPTFKDLWYENTITTVLDSTGPGLAYNKN